MKKSVLMKTLITTVAVIMAVGLTSCSAPESVGETVNTEVTSTEITNSDGQTLDTRFVGTWFLRGQNGNGFVHFTYAEDGTGHYEYYMSSTEEEVEADPSIEPDKARDFDWYVEDGTLYMNNHKDDEDSILDLTYRFDGSMIYMDEDEGSSMILERR